ncbi:hypothetical protein I79_025634 [Cricetulus griseus]|uniref:Uncharacterized protein n=1 Tax=Cricetulus griseus TaxID=10029 RepID=G3INU4_CRIGR|nr:hypothetical protein I79_025634 [Cricetulus griseus]
MALNFLYNQVWPQTPAYISHEPESQMFETTLDIFTVSDLIRKCYGFVFREYSDSRKVLYLAQNHAMLRPDVYDTQVLTSLLQPKLC